MSGSTVEVAGDGGTRRAALLTALVFLVALNLRPALTTVGPLLPQIGADTGLGEGGQGLLGAVPLLAFGLVSPLVHGVSRRLGAERTVLLALLVLAAGTLVRAYAGSAGLWIGTVVVGGAIAVGNVLVPAIIKRDYATRVTFAIGVYSAFIALPAAAASAVAVPIANATDWRGALAVWALPALVVAALWLPRVRDAVGGGGAVSVPVPTVASASVSVWRQPTAWLVTAFMALQSTTFYVMVTWLPTIETSSGVSDAQAGIHLFVYLLVGVPAGLVIPALMRREHQVAAAVTASVPMVIGVSGLLVAPELGLLWAVIAGTGTGAALVVALGLIGLRGRTHDETTQLSGMAQSLGYLLAAAGPVAVGTLAERSGSWDGPLVLLLGVAILQVLVAVVAGRDRRRPTA